MQRACSRSGGARKDAPESNHCQGACARSRDIGPGGTLDTRRRVAKNVAAPMDSFTRLPSVLGFGVPGRGKEANDAVSTLQLARHPRRDDQELHTRSPRAPLRAPALGSVIRLAAAQAAPPQPFGRVRSRGLRLPELFPSSLRALGAVRGALKAFVENLLDRSRRA